MRYKSVLTKWVIVMAVFVGIVPPSEATAQTDDHDVPTVISSVQWQPGGERLLVMGRGQPGHWAVWLYDAEGKHPPVEVLSYEEPVSAHWSPDGSRFTVGRNIVDAQTLDITLTLDAVSGIGGWSPDGTQVLAWTDDTLLGLFDTTTGELVRTVSVGDERPDAVGWSPNGEYFILIHPTGKADIVSADDGRHITTIPMEYPMGLRWSPDSRYLAAGFTESVEAGTPGTLPDAASPRVASVVVWETLTGEVVQRFEGLLNWAAVIRWHPQRPEIAAGTPIGLVYVWNIETGQQLDLLSTIGGSGILDYSPFGGRLVVGGSILRQETLDAQREELYSPDRNQWTHSIVDNVLVLTVPDPSLERLTAIQTVCAQASDAVTSVAVPQRAVDLDEYIAQIEAIPAMQLPPGCAADLVAVAQALQSQ